MSDSSRLSIQFFDRSNSFDFSQFLHNSYARHGLILIQVEPEENGGHAVEADHLGALLGRAFG